MEARSLERVKRRTAECKYCYAPPPIKGNAIDARNTRRGGGRAAVDGTKQFPEPAHLRGDEGDEARSRNGRSMAGCSMHSSQDG